jgi:hypothetical protein
VDLPGAAASRAPGGGPGGAGGGGGGRHAGLAGLAFGYPYWDPWYYGGYGYGGGYWGFGYWGPDYGYWSRDYWAPEYVGYWDAPYYAGWEPDDYDYSYYWRPRLWRRYRRPIARVSYDYAQPAVYQAAVAYGVPANCSGAHYVWDDYGGYVFRPYGFPC